MPVTLATPPTAVLTELARTLPRLSQSAGIEARAPAIARAAARFVLAGNLRVARAVSDIDEADAVPTPVYVVGLDELAKGRLGEGARLALWSHIVATEAGPVSAEVGADNGRFAQVSNGIAVSRVRSSLLRMAKASSADAADGEAAQLRIPALHTSLLWIRGKGETFEVLESSVAGLAVGQHFTAAALLRILKPAAEAALRNPEAEG
jgi:hypothetical protein